MEDTYSKELECDAYCKPNSDPQAALDLSEPIGTSNFAALTPKLTTPCNTLASSSNSRSPLCPHQARGAAVKSRDEQATARQEAHRSKVPPTRSAVNNIPMEAPIRTECLSSFVNHQRCLISGPDESIIGLSYSKPYILNRLSIVTIKPKFDHCGLFGQ